MSREYYWQLQTLTELVEVCYNIYNFLQDQKIQNKQHIGEPREVSFAQLEDTLALIDQEDQVIPLEAALRDQFETAFDADLSSVRVHVGPQANRLAGKMSADAFAIGHDVFFADGKYNPSTQEGIALMAHELTHVVQFLNGERMVFLEDRAALEHTASRTESLMQQSGLHNMRQPHFSTADTAREPEAGRDAEFSEAINTGLDQFPTLDDFMQRDQKPVYRIKFPSGKAYTFSARERQQILQSALDKLSTHLYELRLSLPEDEYARQVAKYLNIIKRGSL